MPRAPKACGRLGCTQRVTARAYCDQHTREQRNRSTWGRGSTRQSRKDRAEVLRRHPQCYLAYDGCTITATEDDHVIPVSQGGSDSLDNRRGACHHCHAIKSKREAAAGRARARAAATHPVERHPGLR